MSKCHSSPISQKISTVNKAQEEILWLEVCRGRGQLKSPWALETWFFLVSPRRRSQGLGKWLLSAAPSTSPFNEEIPLCCRGRSETSGLSLGSNRFTYVFVVATLVPLTGHQPPLFLADCLRLNGAGISQCSCPCSFSDCRLVEFQRIKEPWGWIWPTTTLPSHGALTERLLSADCYSSPSLQTARGWEMAPEGGAQGLRGWGGAPGGRWGVHSPFHCSAGLSIWPSLELGDQGCGRIICQSQWQHLGHWALSAQLRILSPYSAPLPPSHQLPSKIF